MTALSIFLIGVLALAGQVAWALVRRQPESRRLLAVLVALALVGYALTGHPLAPDRPARPIPPDTNAIAAFAEPRQAHLTGAGATGAWLTLSSIPT